MENRFPLLPPKVLYVSNITQDALLSVQNKSLLFYTRHFSNEWCFFFFCFIHCKKKKNVTTEIPHHQQKVPLKNAAIKWRGQNSLIKHQIIKSDIYNHYSQYLEATEKSRFLGGEMSLYLCSSACMRSTAGKVKATDHHQHSVLLVETMLRATEDLLSVLESPM